MRGDWVTVKFGEVLSGGTRNGIYKKKEYHGSGVKIVNMGELFAYPRLRAIPMKRVELTEKELKKSSLEPGDLLFARRSLVAEGAGKCSIVLEVDESTTFESSIIRGRPDPDEADSLFLYYLFNSPHGRYLLGTIRRQVAVAGITGSDLVQLEISLPPLSEQRAIAHILGSLDDKIELNRRMNETLEAMARAIFKSWFVDFDPVRAKAEGRDTGLPGEIANLFPDSFEDSELGAVPEGWKVKSIAAGLDYAGVGPELAYLADAGRIKPRNVSDDETLDAFFDLSRFEGIIPALESAHAVAYVKKAARTGELGDVVVINLSGRGDKDVDSVARREGFA